VCVPIVQFVKDNTAISLLPIKIRQCRFIFLIYFNVVKILTKINWLLYILFWSYSSQVYASGEYRAVGTRIIVPGLGGVSVVSPYNPSGNQAGMAFTESSSLSLYYANTGIAEGVNNFMAMGMYKLKKGGTLGFTGSYFGYELFNDKKFGVGYALKLADFVSIGAQIDVLNNKIAGYASSTSVTFELGTLFKVSKHVDIGAHVYNPVRAKYGKETDERIPTVFRLGATYHTNDKVWITGELEKDLDVNLAFRAGIDYKVNEYVFLRAGFLTLPVSGSLGAGIVFKGLRIELLGAYQKVTGFSPHLGLSYVF